MEPLAGLGVHYFDGDDRASDLLAGLLTDCGDLPQATPQDRTVLFHCSLGLDHTNVQEKEEDAED